MPRFIQWFYPERIWAFPRNKKSVYLTFDDGPIPDVTPWVLEELNKHNAKATFFCIGSNIQKHPEFFQKVISEGHSIGNHTFNHLNGWKTSTAEYVENVEKAGRLMTNDRGRMTDDGNLKTEDRRQLINKYKLFRPPFGKITSKQAKALQERGFKIVMWDIVSYDYEVNISEEKCLQNVLKNIKPGSVIVFHDSLKAQKNLRYVLPKVLEFISEKGMRCERI